MAIIQMLHPKGNIWIMGTSTIGFVDNLMQFKPVTFASLSENIFISEADIPMSVVHMLANDGVRAHSTILVHLGYHYSLRPGG